MEKDLRVLVVDDEPKIRQLLQRLLEREGYRVSTAGDGAAALEEILRERPALVITDLKMPGMDGVELLKRARSIDPDLPVVLITAYASMETAVEALREGVDDYITKPFSINEMKKVVGRILTNRTLAAENARLLGELRIANAELLQHRQRLTVKVVEAEFDLSEANRELGLRLGQMEVIHEINRMTATVFDQGELLDLTTKLIEDKVGVDAAAVLLSDPEETWLVAHGVRSPDGGLRTGDRVPREEGAAGRVVASGKPLLIPDVTEDTRPSDLERRTFGDGSLLLTPIQAKGRLVGLLAVGRGSAGETLGAEEADLLGLIANDLAIGIENARLFEENERNYIEILAALVESMEARDPYLRQHSERVKMKSLELARLLSLPDTDRDMLETGARLHDLGKVGIEDRILHKPGPLDDAEMEKMRSHPVIGDRIVKPLGKLGAVKPIIRHHHEHWDGTGYPDGLTGDEIPLLAQVVSVADAFDALTSRRSYREAMPRADALKVLNSSAGKYFNPLLVEVFTDLETDRLRRHGKLSPE
ncbi:MAG: response regulator [Planctomycetota bacterium]|jgi:response regulator RpfG family c-di-GMP phosphodiesterase